MQDGPCDESRTVLVNDLCIAFDVMPILLVSTVKRIEGDRRKMMILKKW